MPLNRRHLLQLAATAPVLGAAIQPFRAYAAAEPAFSISLAQWSLHRTYFGTSWGPEFRAAFSSDPDAVLQGELHPLDFPVLARREFDIDAVEYVNTFFYGHANDQKYLTDLKGRADGEGVRSLLIMCDALGNTGDSDPAARSQAVENHLPWMEAAAFLGCRAIRVNAAGQGPRDDLSRRVAESLQALGERGSAMGLDVLVENHGGPSSDGAWLAATIALADHPAVGTLPDFGNFRVSGRGDDAVHYDRYRGIEELMPTARAVSAKSYDFDADGFETTIDYPRMLRLVLGAGFSGHIGIEYEGSRLSEFDGIRATRDLLLRLRAEADQLPSNPS